MLSFLIQGGSALRGEISVNGSKNAALPILSATLLTDEPCVIENVPDIEDVRSFCELLRAAGKEVHVSGHKIHVQKKITLGKVISFPEQFVCGMRASVLLAGPLLARAGSVSMAYPGGCVLGKRTFDTHFKAFETFGCKNTSNQDIFEIISPKKKKAAKAILKEFSVTATENVLLYASMVPDETEIHLAAIEPHVQDLCGFLLKMGVSIEGIGTHTLRVKGKAVLRGASHRVTSDYLEAGTLAIAAAITGGKVTLKNMDPAHLTSVWNLMEDMGVEISFAKNSVTVARGGALKSCGRLQTAIFPGFPTDLQAPFAVLLTQAQGDTLVHETLFEGRLNYLVELVKMGARAELKNDHQAVVSGPSTLRGTRVQSCDIRAGAAMILAGLVASGETEVMNVQYIDRGYERFDETLRKLGAKITRLGSDPKTKRKPHPPHRFDIPLLPLREAA